MLSRIPESTCRVAGLASPSPSGGQNMALSLVREQLSGGEDGRTQKWTCPKTGPQIHDLLCGLLGLRRWLRLRLSDLPRFLFRGKLLLDLQSHGVRINTVCLGRCAENFTAI